VTDETSPQDEPGTDCLFCKFVSGAMTPDVVLETDLSLAFRDINPQAPVHVLVIPKAHHATLADLARDAPESLLDLGRAIREVAAQEGLEEGYRTVFNTGAAALQSVHHVHGHVIGGRTMTWPPG
jgi:histidine triad (HIT) family protein